VSEISIHCFLGELVVKVRKLYCAYTAHSIVFFFLSHSPDYLLPLPALLARWSRTRKPQWFVADVQVDARLGTMITTFFGWPRSKKT